MTQQTYLWNGQDLNNLAALLYRVTISGQEEHQIFHTLMTGILQLGQGEYQIVPASLHNHLVVVDTQLKKLYPDMYAEINKSKELSGQVDKLIQDLHDQLEGLKGSLHDSPSKVGVLQGLNKAFVKAKKKAEF